MGGRVGGGSGWIEVLVKIQKKNGGCRRGGVGSGGRVGGSYGCERRIEVFVKIQKKIRGGVGGRGWVGGSGWGSGWM